MEMYLLRYLVFLSVKYRCVHARVLHLHEFILILSHVCICNKVNPNFFFGTEFFIVAVPRWAKSGAFYRSGAEMCLSSLGVTCPIYFWWTSARLVQQCALYPWHFWSRARAELNQPDVLQGGNRMSHCIECCCRQHQLVLGSKVVLCEFCQKTNMQ